MSSYGGPIEREQYLASSVVTTRSVLLSASAILSIILPGCDLPRYNGSSNFTNFVIVSSLSSLSSLLALLPFAFPELPDSTDTKISMALDTYT